MPPPPHRYPWHVLRRGRPILIEEDGRRFYVDRLGDPVYEWPDDEVDPVNLARWEEALAASRLDRKRGSYGPPRPIRPGRRQP